MKPEKIQRLIRVAKNLKAKKDKNQITKFEEEELKQIYKLLVITDNTKNKTEL